MTTSAEFSGVRALVTGGASGIGAATVQLLLDRGAEVASIDLEPSRSSSGCISLQGDVGDPDVGELVVDAAQRLGGMDVVVNNAGIGASGTIETTADAVFRRLYEVNVLGTVRVTRAALPFLRTSTFASVVNTCSVSAQIGLSDRAAYSASKGAVLALTRAMASDHLRDGISVSCVAPATVSSPWIDRLLEAADNPGELRETLERRQPTGRMVTPEEVAAAICFLASPQGRSVTGTVLNVDGGWTTVAHPTGDPPSGGRSR